MPQDPFEGSTRDPVAMLEQLISMVGALRNDVIEVKQDMTAVKQDIAVLKQDVAELKQDVAELKQDVAELKQDVAELKQTSATKQDLQDLRADLKQEISLIRTELGTRIGDMRGDMKEFMINMNKEQEALRSHVDLTIDRRSMITEQKLAQVWEERQDALERRVERLEEAERRRTQGT